MINNYNNQTFKIDLDTLYILFQIHHEIINKTLLKKSFKRHEKFSGTAFFN